MKRVQTLACVVGALLSMGIAAAQNVRVNPQSLSFTYQIGGPNPAAQSLTVSNDVPTTFSVTISGAPWLSISPMSGTTPGTLVATVTPPVGATAGTLNGSIIIGPVASVDAVKLVVPVSLQILPGSPGNLIVAPTSIIFDYVSGGLNPAPYTLSVKSSTGAAATFTLAASTSSGGSWLFVSPNSGVTPATFSASANPPAGMPAGTYTGTISVIPNYTGAVTQTVSVTLRVTSKGTITASPGSLSFSYQPGSPFPNPQTLSINNSVGAPTSVNIFATTSGGGSWLVISPGIATTPVNVIVSVNPAGLGPGVYYGTVNVAPATGGAATLIPVMLNTFNTSQLVVSPTSLSFDYQSGGASPPPQYVSVTSTSSPITFMTSVLGPNWISVSTTQAVTPTGLGVLVNPPLTTPAGTYNATITLTPLSNGGNQVIVVVSVRITAANYLTVAQNSVLFDYAPGDHNPAAVLIPVSSSGGSLRYEAVASSLGFSPWLTATQSSPYTPGHISIGVAPQGLAAGTYSGTVSVVSDEAVNSPVSIQVTLNVSNQPSFTASPFGMVFSYQLGGTPAPMQMAVISNQGTPLAFTLSAETNTGGNWLLIAGGGTTPVTIAAAIDPGQLGPGTYTGNLIVKPTSETGNPLRVPVILNISPDPVFRPSANQVAFQYQTTGPVPQPQKVNVGTTGNSSVVFYTSAETSNGGKWLKVTPDVGSSPADVSISVDPQSLTAGLYYGVVTLTAASGDSPASYIPVSLQISDGEILTVPAQSLIFNANVGAGPTAAQTITVKGTGRASSFQVLTYGGTWPQVSPTFGTADATLNVVATPDGIPAGYNFGVVSIEIPGVAGSQQYVPLAFVLSTP